MISEIEANAAVVPLAHQRRRHHRDDLCFSVRFHVLRDADAQKALDRVQNKTETPAAPGVSDESYMGNLSSGGLGLCGHLNPLKGHTLKEGDLLKIEIQPPRIDASVRCLGRVAWVEILAEGGMFRAGVSFVAVNPDDLKKMLTLVEPIP
jgi:PilZ domain